MASKVFLLLASLLVFDVTWAKLDILAEPATITAKPGDKVQLKCVLQNLGKPLNAKDFMVQWFSRGAQVAEYDEKITINKPGMSMCPDALKKGDATLTIESFAPEHAGNYRCYVYYNSDHSMKQIVLSDSTQPKEDEVLLNSCEIVLDKKLDKIIAWTEKVDTKLDELKKCPK